jgi:ketosteroid isomerase-like protein
MSATETRKADRFIAALRKLEDEDDIDAIAALFSDDAELGNPMIVAQHRGTAGARRFWETYRNSFGTVHSAFRTVVETEDAVVLEWNSRGNTTQGGAFSYDGVSVLHFDGDRIDRFQAYFDPGRLRLALSRAA